MAATVVTAIGVRRMLAGTAGEATGDAVAGAMDGATMVAVAIMAVAALADVASRRLAAAASRVAGAASAADAPAFPAVGAAAALAADMAGAVTAKQRAVLCGFQAPSARRAGGALA